MKYKALLKMNYYLKLSIHSFTIWVLAALINAILSTCCLSVAPNNFGNWIENFTLIFFLTLVFSIPAIFIFWIIYMTTPMDGNALFPQLLRTGFIMAFISAVLFFIFFNSMFKSGAFFLALSIIVAAVTSIMLHHHFIVASYKNKTNRNA